MGGAAPALECVGHRLPGEWANQWAVDENQQLLVPEGQLGHGDSVAAFTLLARLQTAYHGT
jgi:hypothetical protein